MRCDGLVVRCDGSSPFLPSLSTPRDIPLELYALHLRSAVSPARRPAHQPGQPHWRALPETICCPQLNRNLCC